MNRKKEPEPVKAIVKISSSRIPGIPRSITITHVDDDRWFSYSYFNPNMYPNNFVSLVSSCSTRFALFHYYSRNIFIQAQIDRKRFIKQLKEDSIKMFKSNWGREDKIIVSFDGLEMHMCIHGMFSAFKSSLDLFANLICKSYDPKQTIGFNKGKVSGNNISGGRLVNWLNNSAPTTSNANQVADITLKHSLAWISQAVEIRDQLIHRKDHEQIHPMKVQVPTAARKFSDLPIIDDWRMPQGEKLKEYVVTLGNNYRDYFREVIPLLPGVNTSDLPLNVSYDALERDQGRS